MRYVAMGPYENAIHDLAGEMMNFSRAGAYDEEEGYRPLLRKAVAASTLDLRTCGVQLTTDMTVDTRELSYAIR